MTNDELVFVCLQCGHGCASYEDLTSHMEDHEDQKPDIRQLRKTTVFNKNRYGAKFGRGGKKARANDVSEFFFVSCIKLVLVGSKARVLIPVCLNLVGNDSF